MLGLILVGGGCQTEQEEPTSHLLGPQEERLLRQADQALQQYQFQRAMNLVNALEQKLPHSADVAFLRGRIYSELERFSEASTAYRTSLNRRPGYRGAWNNMANNAFRRWEYRKAVRLYHKELEQHRAPVPWRGIGRSYVQLGKVDSARYAFEKALSIDPAFAPAHFSLALLYEDEGAFEPALKHVRKALGVNEDDLRYRYLLGSLLVSAGRNEDALEPLRTVTGEWGWHQSAHYKLGQALLKLGQTEEGQQYLGRAEKLRKLQARITQLEENTMRVHADNSYAHAELASAYRRAGRYDKAMKSYRVALYLEPGNLNILNNVALLHLLRGEQEKAIQGFEHIVEQDSERVDAWVNLGVLYARSERTEDAVRVWKEALRRDPNRPQVKTYLARIQDQ